MDAALKTRFDSDGFIVLPAFFQGGELCQIDTELQRLLRDVAPTMPLQCVFIENGNGSTIVKRLRLLHEHDRFFRELFLDGRLSKLAELLLSDRAIGKNSQYYRKLPGLGHPTPPHQDAWYFKLQQPAALTMWLALDRIDEENGCLRYVRGSNTRGLREHQYSDVPGFSHTIGDYGRPEDLNNEVDVPAWPGDLLVHHALTIHSAGQNNSHNRPRRSLAFTYRAQCVTTDGHETLQAVPQSPEIP